MLYFALSLPFYICNDLKKKVSFKKKKNGERWDEWAKAVQATEQHQPV